MLKIRYQRTGRKNDPAYRIVVTEHTSGPNAGKNVATLGSYHPKTKETNIDAEAVALWMSRGAKASDTVHNLLVSKGIIEGKKRNVLPKKSPIVKEEEEKKEEAAPAAESAEAPEGETPVEENATPQEEKKEAEEKKEETSIPKEEITAAETEAAEEAPEETPKE